MSDEQDLEDVLRQLSERERAFCEHYVGDAAGNGTKAARLAGYAGDATTLSVAAYRLLRKDRVRKVLSAFQELDERVAGRVERLQFLTRVVRGEETEKRPERDSEGNVSMVDCPPALRDRLAAQEALSKLAGEQISKVAQVDSQGNDVKGMTLAELVVLAGMGKVGE